MLYLSVKVYWWLPSTNRLSLMYNSVSSKKELVWLVESKGGKIKGNPKKYTKASDNADWRTQKHSASMNLGSVESLLRPSCDPANRYCKVEVAQRR